jgi:methionyl aminopeptidase
LRRCLAPTVMLMLVCNPSASRRHPVAVCLGREALCNCVLQAPPQPMQHVHIPHPSPPQSFHGDLNETICVGNVDEEGKKLIKVTHDALMKAIAACRPGVRYREVGDIITKHAAAHG